MRGRALRIPVARAIVLAMTMAASIVGTGTTVSATFPGANGEIAYLRAGFTSVDTYSLRTINADGSAGRILWPAGDLEGHGSNQAFPFEAEWSADGSMVAMTAIGLTLGDDRLLIGDPQTGERHGILRISELNDHLFFASIAFSPTGDRVLFCAPDIGSLSNDAYLYTVTVDGDDPIVVSDRPSCYADWSSTDRIAAAAGDHIDRIVTMDPDGTDRHLVVPPAPRPTSWGIGGSPSWSPDGSRFVYSLRVGPTRRFDLFSVAADGSDRVRLTHTPHHDELYPLYSPDGTAVAFTRSIRFQRFQSDLFTMAVDGSGVAQLTDTPRADEYADSWGVQI